MLLVTLEYIFKDQRAQLSAFSPKLKLDVLDLTADVAFFVSEKEVVLAAAPVERRRPRRGQPAIGRLRRRQLARRCLLRRLLARRCLRRLLLPLLLLVLQLLLRFVLP